MCDPCRKRRELLAQVRKQQGVKGVLKAVPTVIRDVVKNPPNIRGKRNG
jgi:hypothetical protein